MQFRQPMLAVSAGINDVVFPIIAQPKYDGLRLTRIPELGTVTRRLKQIPNRFLRRMFDHPALDYYDGEIITFTNGTTDKLNVIQSKVSSEDGEPDFAFFVFDYVDLEMPFAERYKSITKCLPFVRVVENKFFTRKEPYLRWHDGLVADGWEGTIIRDPYGLYKMGRSTVKEGILLKNKPRHDSEATIIGFVEMARNENPQEKDERGYAKRSSTKAGKVPANTLGAFVCEWRNGITFDLPASTLGESGRKKVWDARESYLGRKVTFMYREEGSRGRPLLPILKLIWEEDGAAIDREADMASLI